MGRIYNQKKQNTKRKILRESMPEAELRLWEQLKSKQLSGYKFRRQFSIGAYVTDFYYPRVKLAVEVDGSSHWDKEVIEYDVNRQSEIENLGVNFIRFNNEEVFEDLNNVLEKIRIRINELEKYK